MRTFLSIGAIFLLGIVSCCNMQINSSCVRISPEGELIRENRAVAGFAEADVCCGIKIVLTQDDTEKLEVETYENLLPYLETYVKNNRLVIGWKSGTKIKGNAKAIAYLSARTIEKLSASGGASVEMTNVIKSDRLSMDGSGGCSFHGAVECGNLDVQLSGGGKMNLTGTADNVYASLSGGGTADLGINCRTIRTSTSGGGRLELSGSADDYAMSSSGGGRVNGFDFVVKHFSADLSGGGSAEITATETVNVEASGGGRVRYKGDAVAQKVSLSGGGSVSKVN